MIEVNFLMVDTFSSYIIMGQHALNILGFTLSTLYISMKYSLFNKRVGLFQDDQEISQYCYEGNSR